MIDHTVGITTHFVCPSCKTERSFTREFDVRDKPRYCGGIHSLTHHQVLMVQVNATGPLIRDVVQGFALMMEAVLKRNDFKGGWHKMSTSQIMGRLYEEMRDLNGARKALDRSMGAVVRGRGIDVTHEKEDVKRQAINVANFCMMMVDVLNEA